MQIFNPTNDGKLVLDPIPRQMLAAEIRRHNCCEPEKAIFLSFARGDNEGPDISVILVGEIFCGVSVEILNFSSQSRLPIL